MKNKFFTGQICAYAQIRRLWQEWEITMDFGDLEEFDFNIENEKPTKKFDNIVKEMKKYDLYDIIARIAGLNLLPVNQNKSILLDAVIAELLCVNVYNEGIINDNIMSAGKFRKLISQVNDSDLCMMIDPNENLYVQNVMFHKNYLVFNGIDQTPAYNLQNMIRIIFEYQNDFPDDFIQCVHKLYVFVLGVSDGIAQRINASNTNNDIEENNRLFVPNSEIINECAHLVTLDGDYFDEFFGETDTKNFLSEFGNEDAGETNHRPFYERPFLRNKKNNSIIILNISVLPTFAFYMTIVLAEKYDIKEAVIGRYHEFIWKRCREYLVKLGHYKIQEQNKGFELINNEYYKEMLVSVYNNQYMLVIYLADDGEGYTGATMHDYYPDDRHQAMLEKRISYLRDKFAEVRIGAENIMFLLIISGFGRGMLLGIKKSLSVYKTIKFFPMELECLSINEKNNFLPRYIRAKTKLHTYGLEAFSELNTVSIYTSNHYSFYMSDDLNPANLNIFIALGDSIDYIRQALEKEDRKRVLSYVDGLYAEVVASDNERKIYIEDERSKEKRNALVVSFENCVIWVTSGLITTLDELSIYYSTLDTMTYWLAECRELINKLFFSYNIFHFDILISGKAVEYFYNIPEEREISKLLNLDIENNHIKIVINPNFYWRLNKTDNSSEKELCKFVIGTLCDFASDNFDYESYIEKIFSNPMKKKMFSFDFHKQPYLKPFEFTDYISVHCEDEDFLLDLIGKKLLESNKWTYGVIPKEKRGELANYIVGVLYNMLQEEVEQINPQYVVELIYLDLEKTLYRLMIARERYAFDVSCYPEKKNEILNDYNECNRTSLALKFLMEYIAAKPPKGQKLLGIGQYEYILAICSTIIDWAYKNDLFYYNIFDTPIEILPSDRVGMKQKEFVDMFQYGEVYRQEQLEYNSSFAFRKSSTQKMDDYTNELDEAFKSERGYTYQQFISVISGIIIIGEEIDDNEIYVKKYSDVIEILTQNIEKITAEIITRVIEDISIKAREDFMKLPKPYRKEDVYPWRFNRAYSFNRRPIIQRDDEIIWGNRQLYHMMEYVTGLIYNGTYSTKDKKMSKLIGKISNQRGKLFNNRIVEILNDIGEFQVYPNRKKINKKSICNENGETLGDIDVLFVDVSEKRIYVAETKAFPFSRNPYEMYLEYNEMFVDKGKKKCYITKHKRRIEWVKNHLHDVCTELKLGNTDLWSVIGLFIVEEPIISNQVYNLNVEIISKAELSLERIRKVN